MSSLEAEMMKVCITICTRERPKMLRECLASILPQLQHDDVLMRVIVVENDISSKSTEILQEMARDFGGCDLQYYQETVIGISSARNRAVDEALDWGAQWIVFIDDDEVAAPNWFTEMKIAMNDLSADVLHGPVELLYPDDIPHWQRLKSFRAAKRGAPLETAATNNTAARSWVFRKDQAGLRFDHLLSFSGGEDIDLFRRARSAGAILKWVPEAHVFERVIADRLSQSWHLRRAKRLAANEARSRAKRDGAIAAGITVSLVALRLVCESAAAALLATLHQHPEKRSAYTFKSKLKSIKMKGYLMGLSGRSLPTYKEVEGH